MNILNYKIKFISFILIILAITSCKHNKDKKAELQKLKQDRDKLTEQINKLEADLKLSDKTFSSEKVKYVSVAPVKLQEFNHYIEVQGKVDGEENVGVSAEMPGTVTKIFVKEGQAVKKEQILAQIDDEVMQKGIKELESSLEFVTKLYDKQKNLWDQKIGSEIQYLTAKNNKESLENKLSTLKNQLDMLKIKSPINGTVEDIPIKIGQTVAPGLPIFRVVNFNQVKVIAEVAEAYSPKIKLGNEVVLSFPDINKEIKGQISFSSKYINPTNRTFLVEVRLNPQDIEARANMIAVIKINDYKSPSSFVVPVNLIQKSLDSQFILLSKDENNKKLARKQIVTVGLTYNGLAEIKSGLKEGDNVIAVGFQDLIDGQTISF